MHLPPKHISRFVGIIAYEGQTLDELRKDFEDALTAILRDANPMALSQPNLIKQKHIVFISFLPKSFSFPFFLPIFAPWFVRITRHICSKASQSPPRE